MQQKCAARDNTVHKILLRLPCTFTQYKIVLQFSVWLQAAQNTATILSMALGSTVYYTHPMCVFRQYTTPTSCVFSDNTIYYPHILCVFRQYTTPTSCVSSDNTIYYPHLLCVFRQYKTLPWIPSIKNKWDQNALYTFTQYKTVLHLIPCNPPDNFKKRRR